MRYLMVTLFDYSLSTYIMFFVAILACFVFEFFYLLMMFAKRANVMLRKFGENAKAQANSASPCHFKQLSDYIKFHSNAKQLRENYSFI